MGAAAGGLGAVACATCTGQTLLMRARNSSSSSSSSSSSQLYYPTITSSPTSQSTPTSTFNHPGANVVVMQQALKSGRGGRINCSPRGGSSHLAGCGGLGSLPREIVRGPKGEKLMWVKKNSRNRVSVSADASAQHHHQPSDSEFKGANPPEAARFLENGGASVLAVMESGALHFKEGKGDGDADIQVSKDKIIDAKHKKKGKTLKKAEVIIEVCDPPVPDTVIMPPQKQEGLEADVAGIGVDTLVVADSVYNKELSWLAFNWRVLHMALDLRTPLLERLRFLAISGRNLDEFFCKRIGALKRQEAAGVENLINVQRRMAWTPQQQLKYVAK